MQRFQKFSELHLFIDESGILNKTPSDDNFCMIGGILFWGEYNQYNEEILKYLTDALENVYSSKEYSNLHYFAQKSCDSDSSYWPNKNKFLRQLKGNIDQWKASNDGFIMEGFSIIHKEDIHLDASSLISEKEIDNRYLLMLRTLFEQLLFVDPRIGERLQRKATLHFHIASRKVVFDENNPQRIKILRAQMEKQGYQRNKNSRDLEISQILSEKELRGCLREIQNRWSRSHSYEYCFETKSINYSNRESLSLAGYYLADLWLGKKGFVVKKGLKSSDLLLPEYGQWSYELASMELAACKASYDHQNYTYFLDLLWDKPDIVANMLFDDFKKKVITQLSGEQINTLLEKVKRAIDSPRMENQFDHARKVLANIEEMLCDSSQITEQITRQLDWIHLSIANHTGNTDLGNKVWEEFEKHFSCWENDTPENLLAFQTEMVLRRVVNLIDTFDYEKADRLLEDITRKQKAVFQFFRDCELFTFKPYRPVLGYCISSLGQIQAFQAKSEENFKMASESFINALNFYDPQCNRQDIERTWNYIGHIACDLQKRSLPYGKLLWNQVRSKLNLPLFSDQNWGSWMLTNDNRYTLALWIKAALVFCSEEEMDAILNSIQNNSGFQNVIAQVQNNPESIPHPWSLIFQSIAMMYVRRFQETGLTKLYHLALFHFDKTETLLSVFHGYLFQFLLNMTQMRKEFLILKSPDKTEDRSKLKKLYQDVQALLVLYFGEQAWKENANGPDGGFFGSLIDKSDRIENNAQRIIDAVTFNYW